MNNYVITVLGADGEKFYFSEKTNWVPVLSEATIFHLKSDALDNFIEAGVLPTFTEIGVGIPTYHRNNINFKTLKLEVIGSIEEKELFNPEELEMIDSILSSSVIKLVSQLDDILDNKLETLSNEEDETGEYDEAAKKILGDAGCDCGCCDEESDSQSDTEECEEECDENCSTCEFAVSEEEL